MNARKNQKDGLSKELRFFNFEEDNKRLRREENPMQINKTEELIR